MKVTDEARSSFSLCIPTLALCCTLSPICTSNSTGKVSLMECGHPGICVDVVSKCSQKVDLVIGFCFRPSATEDVGHDALWLAN